MRKLRIRGMKERGVAFLITAGFMLFARVLSLSAQLTTDMAVDSQDNIPANEVSSLDDLAGRFLDTQSRFQMISPPSSDLVLHQDEGILVFDPKSFPESFSKSLIQMMEYDCPVYAVTGVEDPASRSVLFFNSEDEKITSVAEPAGYDPWWMLNLYHPTLYSGGYSQQEINQLMNEFDPARVRITWKLLPVDYVEKYAQALADVQAESEIQSLNKDARGGVLPMMRYQGPPVSDLTMAGIERMTNGIRLTLAYPFDFTNRVDFFTCADLVASWWDLAVNATNVNTSTNWIEWTDTAALSQPLRFYAAGNADMDSDLDGLSDAREQFMYHTSSTNTDSDADGLGDYYEIMTLNTDPTNPKTNKPNVQISYPANASRKVWLP